MAPVGHRPAAVAGRGQLAGMSSFLARAARDQGVVARGETFEHTEGRGRLGDNVLSPLLMPCAVNERGSAR